MQRVFGSCVVMAFSSSSNVPFFFSFLTRDLTAFSHHLSSCKRPIEKVNAERYFINMYVEQYSHEKMRPNIADEPFTCKFMYNVS